MPAYTLVTLTTEAEKDIRRDIKDSLILHLEKAEDGTWFYAGDFVSLCPLCRSQARMIFNKRGRLMVGCKICKVYEITNPIRKPFKEPQGSPAPQEEQV